MYSTTKKIKQYDFETSNLNWTPGCWQYDRATLMFIDTRLEFEFRRAQHGHRTFRIARLGRLLLVVNILSMCTFIFVDNSERQSNDWVWAMLLRGAFTLISVPTLYASRVHPWLLGPLTALMLAFCMIQGFFTILIDTRHCVQLTGTSYGNAAVGQLLLITANVITVTSDVFLMRSMCLLCAIPIFLYICLYFLFSGVLGNKCIVGGCQMNANFLFYYFAVTIILLFTGYEAERYERSRFVNGIILYKIQELIAVMNLDEAETLLLQDAQRPKSSPERADDLRMLQIVEQLKHYKPFLPESIFTRAEKNDGWDDVDDVDEIDAALTTAITAIGRRGSIRELGTSMEMGVRRVVGTVMRIACNEIFNMADTKDFLNIDRIFLEIALSTVEKHDGVVLRFGAGTVVATWNAARPCLQPQLLACRAAFQTLQRVKFEGISCQISIASGMLTCGVSGTATKQTPVVQGLPMRKSLRLLQLNSTLQSNILTTQSVYEAVEAFCTLQLVDYVMFEGVPEPCAVYQLQALHQSSIPPQVTSIYKDAFVHLRHGRFDECIASLSQYVESLLPYNYQKKMVAQTTRLLRIALGLKQRDRELGIPPGKTSYIRHDGWQAIEEDLDTEGLFEEYVQTLPTNVQDTIQTVSQRTLGTVEQPGSQFRLDLKRMDTKSELIHHVESGEGSSKDIKSSVTLLNGKDTETFIDKQGQQWIMSDTLLGEGAFGQVMLGMSNNGMLVAIKKLTIDTSKVTELLNEIGILQQFKHENIVAYCGSTLVHGKLHIVMEYVACGALSSIIQKFGKLSVSATQSYTRDICRGLSYLHSEGVVHRDIKPQNVLLTQAGQCKLADFGTAGTITEMDRHIAAGTPQYMAPEVFQGEMVLKSDLWSVGITTLEMLTAKTLKAVEAKTNIVTIMATISQFTTVPDLPPDLPPVALAFITLCLQPNPDLRKPAHEMLEHAFLI